MANSPTNPPTTATVSSTSPLPVTKAAALRSRMSPSKKPSNPPAKTTTPPSSYPPSTTCPNSPSPENSAARASAPAASTPVPKQSPSPPQASSSSAADSDTTIKLTGEPHLAISVRSGRGRRSNDDASDASSAGAETRITDAYVPSGADSFNVQSAPGLSVGDWISIRRPVTEKWVQFMHMDDMTRDGKPQTWIRSGNVTTHERKITAITGNKITVDVPLPDSFDAAYLNPPGASVVKIKPPNDLSQCAVESLHILSPPQAYQSHGSAPSSSSQRPRLLGPRSPHRRNHELRRCQPPARSPSAISPSTAKPLTSAHPNPPSSPPTPRKSF